MARRQFETDGGFGAAAVGLIVLATDETMEPELAPLFARAGTTLYHARIPSDPEVTPETLARMEAALPATAALFPAAARFRAIGYGCTSGATVIGPDRVESLVQGVVGDVPVTNPLSAVIAACAALGVNRLGMLTPYVPSVSAALRDRLADAGIGIAGFASFEEGEEQVVARIAEGSTASALGALAAQGCDALFASCTNLRTFGVVDAVEQETGLPVLSSNSALAWHLGQLAGVRPAGPGRLFDL